MRPFSQFIRIFVGQVGEKSTIKWEVEGWLTYEQSASLWVAELLEMDG